MRIRPKIGDVFAIPIHEGKYMYCRLYKDASVAVYDLITDELIDIPSLQGRSFLLFSGVFTTAMKDSSWPRIGNLPFQNEDEAWPPPQYRQDILNPSKYSIYYRGESRPASQQETVGLDKCLMRKPDQLIDEALHRISGRKF